jgi:hypothetical protein
MRGKIGLIILILLGIAMLAGGVAGLISNNRAMAEARTWPSVQGQIEESRIEMRRTGGRRPHNEYDPIVSYAYDVAGQTYRNDDIAVAGALSSSSRSSVEDTLRDYPVGAKVQVFYSPADPSRSALRVEAYSGIWYFLCGLGPILLALAGFMIWRRR